MVAKIVVRPMIDAGLKSIMKVETWKESWLVVARERMMNTR